MFAHWRCPCQSNEDSFAFIDATLPSLDLGLLKAPTNYFYGDYHNRKRAREIYILTACEMGDGMTAERVYKLSTENF